MTVARVMLVDDLVAISLVRAVSGCAPSVAGPRFQMVRLWLVALLASMARAEVVCEPSLYTPLVVYFFLTLGVALLVGVVSLWRYRVRRRALSETSRSPATDDAAVDESARESWSIQYRELRLGRRIGAGNVGEVYEATYRGQRVAVKRLLSSWCSDEDMVERFREEILLMSTMNHPNVLLFIGAVLDTQAGNLCLVTELCAKGTLQDVLHSSEPLPWSRRLSLAMDVARGMQYLHRRVGIIQRDLKSANLLVNDYLQVKIADFGLSRRLQPGRMDTYCGTPATMAPEIVLQERYDEKADVFSFGIILWEILTRSDPYPGLSGLALAYSVARDGVRPPVPAYCPLEYASVMTRAWSRDPRDRPSFDDVLDVLQSMQ
jgi:serine/threonine protein kinase